jgi:hypothetical protein
MTRRRSVTELERAEPTGQERMLVSFFYAHNVGHAVEACITVSAIIWPTLRAKSASR